VADERPRNPSSMSLHEALVKAVSFVSPLRMQSGLIEEEEEEDEEEEGEGPSGVSGRSAEVGGGAVGDRVVGGGAGVGSGVGGVGGRGSVAGVGVGSGVVRKVLVQHSDEEHSKSASEDEQEEEKSDPTFVGGGLGGPGGLGGLGGGMSRAASIRFQQQQDNAGVVRSLPASAHPSRTPSPAGTVRQSATPTGPTAHTGPTPTPTAPTPTPTAVQRVVPDPWDRDFGGLFSSGYVGRQEDAPDAAPSSTHPTQPIYATHPAHPALPTHQGDSPLPTHRHSQASQDDLDDQANTHTHTHVGNQAGSPAPAARPPNVALLSFSPSVRGVLGLFGSPSASAVNTARNNSAHNSTANSLRSAGGGGEGDVFRTSVKYKKRAPGHYEI
jgi:hypothetical protein